MERRAKLFEAPEFGGGDMLFSLKEITSTPEAPRMNEPFVVRGKIDLFKLPFFGPIWIIATVLYPERWWEEIIPIVGSPEIRKDTIALGSDFEISFPKGFDREGEYTLSVRAYGGPTLPLDSIVLPPFPPVSTVEGTFTVEGEVPEEETAFSLTRPTVSPTDHPEPETEITISCPVLSEATKEQNIKVKCIIYEGSILPGHGTKLAEYISEEVAIVPGESKTFDFTRATVAGSIDRRDVEVEVYIAGKLVKESEWDDVYYVGKPPEEEIDFGLTRPSVTPAEITPGTPITITCPVTSACTKEQTVTAKVIIYEGSILPGHGTKLKEYTSPAFTIAPGASYNVVVSHTAVAGSIDRRDVEVEINIAGKIVKQSEWDDVYYVLTEELELLEIKIDPAGTGTVTTDPEPSEGTQHNWYFPHGTTVQVTAHPKAGYIFKSWSGEMTDTAAITAPVYPMTEKRTITAHFREEEAPPKADIKDFDFRATGGTYGIGEKVPFTAPYDYKGKAQSGRLTIFLGTGVYPSFFTKHTFSPVSVSFKESMDWRGGVINGQFTLPSTLKPGQTYSVRAKLEAISDYTQETDTDWGVLKIAEAPIGYVLTIDVSPAGAGTVTKSPNKTTYSPGEKVTLTASPKSGYEFDHWGGAASGTSPTATVTMDSDKLVVAVFREVAPPVGISFSVMLTSIPSWLIPVYEWYIVWRGKTHGQWTDVSYGITLEDVKATGAMTAVLKTATGTRSFTTQTYTLEDGRTYKFNVEYLRLE